MKRVILAFITVSLFLSLFGCGTNEKKKFTEYYFDWFDTATIVTGYEYSEEDFNEVTSEIEKIFSRYHRLYNIYNKYDDVNNLATVNTKTAGSHSVVPVDEEIIDLIDFSYEMYHLTGGKFNIAMGSVLSLWHTYREFGLDNPADAELPPMDKLITASQHMSIDDIVIDRDEKTVYLKDENMSLDVGAVAKGYACEQAAKRLEAMGISEYIINAGGNIRCIGSKPNGDKWLVGLENPDLNDTDNPYIAYLKLDSQALVTSGSYQRFYVVNGKNYHHIIDPETLMPSERYLSVSVICHDSGMGDALSTALFNMEYAEGRALISSLEDVEALWVLPDGEIMYSENFANFMS